MLKKRFMSVSKILSPKIHSQRSLLLGCLNPNSFDYQHIFLSIVFQILINGLSLVVNKVDEGNVEVKLARVVPLISDQKFTVYLGPV